MANLRQPPGATTAPWRMQTKSQTISNSFREPNSGGQDSRKCGIRDDMLMVSNSPRDGEEQLGGKQPPRGTGPGGELPPQRPGGGSQGPATIEMLLAFLILGLRDTLAVSKLSLTLTSNEVHIQVPSLLALAAILLALSVRDRWRH